MSVETLRYPPLVETLWPADSRSWPRKAALVVGGSLLLALSAKLQVPFWPVPLTMQTLVVLVLGMAYGGRLAGATLLLYLAQGAMGLPVFAGTPEKGIGIAYMIGPTGGYLAGFLLAATVCGVLAERGWDRNVWTTALAMAIGSALIYIPGVLWLGSLIGWDKPVLQWGLIPFLPGDVAKIGLAALGLPVVWRLLGRSGTR